MKKASEKRYPIAFVVLAIISLLALLVLSVWLKFKLFKYPTCSNGIVTNLFDMLYLIRVKGTSIH